jgi:hypothetical protein
LCFERTLAVGEFCEHGGELESDAHGDSEGTG